MYKGGRKFFDRYPIANIGDVIQNFDSIEKNVRSMVEAIVKYEEETCLNQFKNGQTSAKFNSMSYTHTIVCRSDDFTGSCDPDVHKNKG